MKASELKKDTRATIRVSSVVKERLKSVLNKSVQEAFDWYIDANLIFEFLPNQGQNNGENNMAKKVTKKAGAKKDESKKKVGKTKATKQSGASKASKK